VSRRSARITPSGLEGATKARLGVVSDTHNQLRPSLLELYRGVDLILHGGDVTAAWVLAGLTEVAPVLAVRGNNDPEGMELPIKLELDIAGFQIAIIHGDRHPLRAKRAALAASFPDADLVIYGHTHRAAREEFGKTLVVNPGAAGPRRFSTPSATAAILTLSPGGLEWTLLDLP
jgi:putative phosphoesterase